MRTRSASRRCVVKRDWPGRRRASQGWMSASHSGRRGGTPSTTTPIAGPWLSPQVVKRNRVPKELPANLEDPSSDDRDVGRVDCLHADDVVTAIHMMHLAADPGRQVAEQIEAGAADILDRDVALQRRVQ